MATGNQVFLFDRWSQSTRPRANQLRRPTSSAENKRNKNLGACRRRVPRGCADLTATRRCISLTTAPMPTLRSVRTLGVRRRHSPPKKASRSCRLHLQPRAPFSAARLYLCNHEGHRSLKNEGFLLRLWQPYFCVGASSGWVVARPFAATYPSSFGLPPFSSSRLFRLLAAGARRAGLRRYSGTSLSPATCLLDS